MTTKFKKIATNDIDKTSFAKHWSNVEFAQIIQCQLMTQKKTYWIQLNQINK